MKTRPLAAALLLALAPATFPTQAWAQPAQEDATTAMARARFKEGVEFYDKGEFEQARASFLQAYALKRHPAVLLNLAWSCVKSGHALEAEKYFKQFLGEGKDITDKQKADANDGLNQAHAKLGRIEINAAAGTEVTVDGEKVGTAPLADPVAVEAGAHTVKFKGPDGATDTQSVTVLGGEKATAKFKGGSGAATSPTASSTAPSTEPSSSPPATEPPAEEKKPAETPHTPPGGESHANNPLAPPANLVPAVALGVLAVAGYVVAGVMVVSKNSAQNQANSTANEIVSHGGGSGTCSPPIASNFQQACNAYNTDNTQINQDATAGNIAVGVGVAATVGFIAYWLIADKGGNGSQAMRPVVTPMAGPRLGGLSLSASF